MVMTPFERARRVVAAAYARRNADAVTLELLESLERENAALRASIDDKRRHGYTRTGRYVSGRAVSALLVCFGLAVVVSWYQYTAEGDCFRQGFAEGARHRPAAGTTSDNVCKAHAGDAILSGKQAPTATEEVAP